MWAGFAPSIWDYSEANSFARCGENGNLPAPGPFVKPVRGEVLAGAVARLSILSYPVRAVPASARLKGRRPIADPRFVSVRAPTTIRRPQRRYHHAHQ